MAAAAHGEWKSIAPAPIDHHANGFGRFAERAQLGLERRAQVEGRLVIVRRQMI
jgi:hypothetical protein